MTVGGGGGDAAGDVVIFDGVEGHAEEEEEGHGGDAEDAVFVGGGGGEWKEGEGEKGAAQEEQHGDVQVTDKAIRPDHAQGEGDDEAKKGSVLPVHQRLFSSLMRCSGSVAPKT